MTIALLYLLIKKNINLNITKIVYCFLTLIALFIATGATSQVTANFTTVDSTSSCGSLVVEFQDLSTGSPTSWLWDLGNGNTSTLKNPIAIYSSAGVYDIELSVSDSVTSDSKVALAFIRVFEKPIANIDINTSNIGCISHYVEFLDISQGADSITEWFWDFGEGGNSNLQHPTYTYLSDGAYTVSLLVKDVNSCQDLVTLPDYIKTDHKPIANFSADVLFSCNTNELVSFNDLSIGNNLSYFWDFGDGLTSNLSSPTHNYTSGVYTVSLIVNNGLCSDTIIMQDYIEIGATTTTNFSSNIDSGCGDLTVRFTDISSSGVDTWFWDFGDGTTSILQNPNHIYTTAGVYDVLLETSINGTCYSDKIGFGAIEVFEKPNILFNASATFSCDTPFVVDFIDQTTSAISWSWDFGNGMTSNLQSPTVLYDSTGIYTVLLSVIDVNACSNTLVDTNYITIEKPIAAFQASNLSGCNPLSTSFIDTSVSNQTITSWYWDFGDGSISSLQNPSYQYNVSGFYDVSLQIVDNLGCSATKTINSYIQVADPPQTDFIANPLIVCAGTNINFTDLSTTSTTIDTWFWDFGDGMSSVNQNPLHSYNIVGTYDVSLTTSSVGCADTFSINHYIKVIEPTAFFKEIYNCPDPLKVEFINLSIGADQVFWDFGDGITSSLSNPTHTFSSRGTYNVILLATNNTTGCVHDFILPIKVTEPKANFTYLVNPNNGLEDSVGCRPHHVHLENLSQDVSYYKVLWEDGYIGYGRLDHLFDTVGTFDVSMVITDIHNCKDTFTYPNMFSLKDFKADFEITNVMGCDSLLVEFNDLTTPNATVLWDFGDGGSSSTNQTQHIYYNEGIYDVTLFAKSSYGCKDTMQKLQYIQFTYPIADFTVNKNTACFDEQITFINQSSGMSLSYLWGFGDGSTSANFSSTHAYTQNGIFDISLSVVDSFGCAHYIQKSAHILVQEPIANFTANIKSSDCPPLITDFSNLSSTDATVFSWDFGDGTTSNLASPSHLYAFSGLYDVSLMVENNIGCKDTFVQNGLVNISGPIGTFTITDNQICLDDTAIFTLNVSNTISYLWDFGDGSFSVDSQATHLYANPGVYFPSLVLENNSSCEFIVQSTDSIVVRRINIDVGNTVSICRNDSISLLAIADSGSVLWYPALFLSNPNVSNPIATPTTTTVFIASITDGVCENSDSVLVVVDQQVPTPTISVSNQCEEDTLLFTANSGLVTNNIAWFWDLGNGYSSNMQNAVQQYAMAGNYLISLLATNLDNACATKIYKTIDVYASPLADFTANEVCLGDLTSFSNFSTSVDGEIVQWYWDFGDAAGLSIQEYPKYQYANHGTYAVSLNVLSDYGCEHQITKNVMINELPIADFITINACQNDYNLFQSTSTIDLGSINNWNWEFGDGNTFSGDRETQNLYQNEGVFDVKLQITSDKGCESEITLQTSVYPLPNPNFSTAYICEGDNTVFYENATISSGSIISWNWDFGDGTGTANYKNPNYQYLSVGTFPVSLTLLSDQLCENTITNSITIYPLPKVEIYADEQTCVGDEIKLVDLSSVDGGYISNWSWNLGDGTIIDQQMVSHIYQSTGVYTVSLDVTSNVGCFNSKTISNMINVFANPIADFLASSQILSINNPKVMFSDQSNGANSWLWDFGNGNTSTLQNPSITFSDTGKYIVSLLIRNTDGCTDKFYREIKVSPEFTLFIPNSFTPNNDGLDDNFLAYGEGISNFRMDIFNRWGDIIFTTFDKATGWNGKDRFDKIISNGIYLYHIAVSDFNGKPWVYNGEVNLMR
ncbi:MAG: PKD domain-containing protein [Bacteroidota bacterium]|nr:PKD domain-containing protein [Bacteroidota bacterium]